MQMGRKRSEEKAETDGFKRGVEWLPEPAIRRVANGIPNRSHRLKGLGNAIVPQVAEVFLSAIFAEIQKEKGGLCAK